MREATNLRGNFVCIHQAIQRCENRADCFDRVGGGIHTDDCVSTAVEKSLECRQKNAADVVSRVIGLHADAEHSTLSHGIAAVCDVADFGGCQHEIFVAHQLGYRGGDFWDDGLLKRLELSVCGSLVEEELAKLAYGKACSLNVSRMSWVTSS